MKLSPLAAALAVQEKEPQPAGQAAPEVPRRPARPGKRQVSVYLPIPVHEYLRRLAFESRRSQHSILMEGLDRVLREHGTSVEQLEKKGTGA